MSETVKEARGRQAAPEGLPEGTTAESEQPERPGPYRWTREEAKAASALGQASLAAGRARREAAQPGDVIRYLRTPVNVAATVRRLAAEAQRGSTHASRELRAWMAELEADIPTSTSELDAKTRARLLQRLLSELQQEDADQALQGAVAPRQAEDDPAPHPPSGDAADGS